ncbi:MAG: tRNA lysidine(34) synthetase TilS, partial [Oscillospiraceae bacterium]|nr:tRNA lysidine(34) synthetase TilS [Oscillospiraceae bacterium]
MMEFDIKRLFETDKGKSLYADFLRIVKEYNMGEKIRDGVLIGFSGGADSVMLACALYKFTQDNNFRPPVAVHINHMIRGEEADRDENFSRNFCKCLGIEFLSFSFDVPKEAKKYSLGLEEAAREVRYSAFNDLLNRRQDLSSIAVAHNATDNLETVIFHMMRGTGTRGMAGISPVRDNIIRPLLYVPKRDIVSALEVSSVPYVIDSTNSEIDYKRNYIRAEMLPKLFFLAENPEAQITKLTKNLRADDLYIESVARSFVDKFSDNIIPKKELLELNSAVLYRVIGIIAKSGLSLGIENVHASKIHELIHSGKDNFSFNLPGGV